MKRLVPLALAALAAACSPAEPAPARVEIADAVCRPAAPGRTVTGCYLALTASRDDRLVSVASSRAREIQIHEMTTEDGLMRMAPLLGGLPLPAGQAVRLAPGGTHLMVFGATGSLAEGGVLPMTLTFEHAPPLETAFRIGQPAAGHEHGHGSAATARP